jgi:spore coat polysaccharide biosynthesis protein SpsF (cytidylyltransferase family)
MTVELFLPDLFYFVQARMKSTRLPGKMLMSLGNISLLENVVADLPPQRTVILTSVEKADDAIADLCARKGINCFRGSELNVFERFRQAAGLYPANFYVRLTGDNPMIVKKAVPEMLKQMCAEKLDYMVSHGIYLGGTLEIFSAGSFFAQATMELSESQKEHVTPAYYAPGSKWRMGRFNLGFPELEGLRLTIDEQTDFDLVSSLCEKLAKNACEISIADLQQLLKTSPELFNKNRNVRQRGLAVQK